MPNPSGRFVWYELMTTDTKGAETFYRAVMGWQAHDSGLPGVSYTIFSVGESPAGGLMAMPAEASAAGARPGWNGYIGVNDVDASAAQVTRAGGVVHHGPADIPSVGRFAMVADPQGAGFALFKGQGEMPAQPPAGAPGHTGWHELRAGEWRSAFAFYSDLFGWTKDQAVDMGEMGTYQTFAVDGVQVGGMMTKTAEMPKPHWLYYFNVAEIEAAAARVRDAGGQILGGPHQVPGGSWILHCADPQSAMFALVGPKG